ncbi:DUF116 domain-containing protein [uncultured Methanobrevibacter sp.]|uniref:DUF116 domain-containing protein n=1 Tax=uncultured Methanobrevibacter sp. TaxID=253161 RepID=UPI0025E786D5|nr:DUF116 domain-containing protein [uncultured Methanobrevibacter sp.]
MFFTSIFEIIGQSIVFIIVLIIILLLVAIILGQILLQKDKLIFPKLLIFVSDILYTPLKWLSIKLGFDENMIDQIGIDVRNQVNKNKFKKIDNNKKILFLPHCLRAGTCKARLDETGLVCYKCGKCCVGEIKEKAESIGYKVFIVPGSSFVKKIMKNCEFESIVGVACYEDLNFTMMKLNKFTPQGVLLSKSGCFETEVNVDNVLERIGYFDIYPKSKKYNENTSQLCVKENEQRAK